MMAGLVTSVLIHGSVPIDVSKILTALVILCSLFSPPCPPFPRLLSSPEADPVDRINWAPYWLLVDLCFHLANRRNQQKEKERDRDRASLQSEPAERTERRGEGAFSLLVLQLLQLCGPVPSGLRVTVAYL